MLSAILTLHYYYHHQYFQLTDMMPPNIEEVNKFQFCFYNGDVLCFINHYIQKDPLQPLSFLSIIDKV